MTYYTSDITVLFTNEDGSLVSKSDYASLKEKIADFDIGDWQLGYKKDAGGMLLVHAAPDDSSHESPFSVVPALFSVITEAQSLSLVADSALGTFVDEDGAGVFSFAPSGKKNYVATVTHVSYAGKKGNVITQHSFSSKEYFAKELTTEQMLKKIAKSKVVLGGEQTTAKAEKKAKKAKKDPNAPKRPQSAYFLWLNANREALKKANPGAKVTDIARLGGAKWKTVNAKEKKKYEDLNAKDKVRYEKEMKAYKA